VIVLAVFASSLCGGTARAGDADHDRRIDELCTLLKDDPSFKVRASAARQLGNVTQLSSQDERLATNALRKALFDDAVVVRGFAAHAIGQRGARELIGELQALRLRDDNEFVRTAASNAIDTLKSGSRSMSGRRGTSAGSAELSPADRASRKKQKVELGQVRFAAGPSTRWGYLNQPGGVLIDAVKNAIEDLIEPRRPAMWPREDPDVRLDVYVVRSEDSTSAKRISYEARVTVVALPGANLRHASNARATINMTHNAQLKIHEIEKDLALKATTRAVSEALALLDK
jgi:hypothetical protein